MAMITTDALSTEDRADQLLADLSPTAWVVVEATRDVPLTEADVGRLAVDCPTWALWNPGIAAVRHRGGPRGEPGMLCRLVVGTRRWGLTAHNVLMGRGSGCVLYAGGWQGGRVIDEIRFVTLRSSPTPATQVFRRFEIQLAGKWRLLRPLIRVLARRHLHRALAGLS